MQENIINFVENISKITSNSKLMTRHGNKNLLVLLSIICLEYIENQTWAIK